MLNVSRETHPIRFEQAKITDIYLLQYTLKQVYGKSPWSYMIFWTELMRKSVSSYLKIFVEDTYVGFVGLRYDEDETHITSIAVLSKYQNQGIGSQTISHVIQIARDRGCSMITLEVKKSNEAAIYLYKKFGFFETGIKKNYYKENHEDAIDMVLVVDES